MAQIGPRINDPIIGSDKFKWAGGQGSCGPGTRLSESIEIMMLDSDPDSEVPRGEGGPGRRGASQRPVEALEATRTRDIGLPK